MFLELEAKIAVIPDTFRETDTALFRCRQYVRATINGWLAPQKLIFDLSPCCDGDEMRLFLGTRDNTRLMRLTERRPATLKMQNLMPFVSSDSFFFFGSHIVFPPPFWFSQDH